MTVSITENRERFQFGHSQHPYANNSSIARAVAKLARDGERAERRQRAADEAARRAAMGAR